MTATDPRVAKRWRLARSRGIHTWVDAAPTRRRIRALLAAGATQYAIADRAGLHTSTVSKILKRQQVRRETAAAIRAVTAADLYNRSGDLGRVPATGTRRRIHALTAIGHDVNAIARAAGDGMTVAAVANLSNDRGPWVSRRNHDRIAAAYTALSATPGASVKARAQARRFGWPPPLAYDDDAINDPHAQPQHDLPDPADRDIDQVAVERRTAGDHTVQLTREERLAAIERLHAAGLNDHQIADRLGYNARTVLRDRQHLGLPANEQAGKHHKKGTAA